MPRHIMTVCIVGFSLALLSGSVLSQQSVPVSDAVRVAQAPNSTIGLIAGGPGSTDARIATDMAEVLNDGDRLRILPMLGSGSLQNIADLIFLKGVDVAIVQTDVLTQILQLGSLPRATSIQYIAKLFPEEVHILARKDIASLSALSGQVVAIGPVGSDKELTATALLNSFHIVANITHDTEPAALERLRHNEIAAMVVIGGEPVPMLREIEAGTGLHFLSIPLNAQLVDAYLPTNLDHQHYPDLVPAGAPIDTIAVGSVLVTLSTPADTARAKRVNRFVDTLFERFDQFHQPGFHPKWQEVNLSAQLPGWTRYPAVQALLRKDQPNDANLRSSFSTYLKKSGQTTAGMNNERREALFRDFMRWRDQHNGP